MPTLKMHRVVLVADYSCSETLLLSVSVFYICLVYNQQLIVSLIYSVCCSFFETILFPPEIRSSVLMWYLCSLRVLMLMFVVGQPWHSE